MFDARAADRLRPFDCWWQDPLVAPRTIGRLLYDDRGSERIVTAQAGSGASIPVAMEPGGRHSSTILAVGSAISRLVGTGSTALHLIACYWADPIPPGPQELHIAMTSSWNDDTMGVINVHVALVAEGHDDDPAAAARGRLRFAVSDGLPPDARRPGVSPAVATRGWIDQLAARFDDHEGLLNAGGSFDGTVGFTCDDRSMALRIYRGRVIDHGRRLQGSPTYGIEADEPTWLRLLLSSRNELVPLTTRGRLRSSGDRVQHLRTTRMLHVLIDEARAMVTPGGSS